MTHQHISGGTLLQRSPQLSAVEMDGQFVMLDVNSGAYFAMDAVGGVVWEALETPTSFGDLVALVVQTFDGASRSEIEVDLQEFLARLLSDGLIESVSAK